MIFTFDETIPKNTPSNNPKTYKLKITQGLIYQVRVTFPPGSAGLMGLAIIHKSVRIWPSTPGKWFRGDNVSFSFQETYLIESEPYFLDIFTYNEDDTYDHQVFLKIGLVSKKVFMARFMPSLQKDMWKEILSELKQEQQDMSEKQREEFFDKRYPFGG